MEPSASDPSPDPARDTNRTSPVEPHPVSTRPGSSGPRPGERIASAEPVPRSRVVLFFTLAMIGATVDLWTKAAVFSRRGLPGVSDTLWIIPDVLGIETAVNIGAVFGIGAGKGLLFAGFSIVALVGILVWLFRFQAAHSLWLTWALGMVTGGILGNLYDRLGMWWQADFPPAWQSGVRDWILFRIEGVPLLDPWPNFNIADSLLVVGACMLLYQSFFPETLSKTSSADEKSGLDAKVADSASTPPTR